MENNLIHLPVSIGEAIDKLTILDIKIVKINDKRKIDVVNEYQLLYDKLKVFIGKHNNLYQQMKKVNLLIWDMMDELRDGNLNDIKYLKICKKCIEYNDIRFRIKNKINDKSKSILKEQKGYLINNISIKICENVSIENIINPIKYLSLIKDQVSIFSLIEHKLKNHFDDDTNVIFKEKINENENFIEIKDNYDYFLICQVLNIDLDEIDILI